MGSNNSRKGPKIEILLVKNEIKLVLLGNSAVGKSSIACQYVNE